MSKLQNILPHKVKKNKKQKKKPATLSPSYKGFLSKIINSLLENGC